MAFDSSADLLFKISADPNEATANIARFRGLMGKDLAGIKSEFESWAKSVFGSVSTLQGAMTAGIAGGLAAIAAGTAAAVALGKALWETGEKAAKYAEEIEDGIDKTGLSAEAMSGLRYAAKNADLGYEELVGSLVRFEVAVTKGLAPSSEQAKVFARLGISQKDVQAGSRDLLPLLYKVSDAFRGHADGALKAAAARELFGRSGAGMIEFLNQGADGMRLFADEAERMGLVLRERDVIAAKAFRLEMIALNAQMEGLKVQIGTGLLPVMGELTVGLEAFLRTAPKVAEIYGKVDWWKGLIPGGREIMAVREGLKVWESELEEARSRLAARMRAAMSEGGKPLPAPAEAPKEAAQEWWGLSGILEGVKSKLAGVGTEEERIAGETMRLNYELVKAGAEFNRLRAQGKLSTETVAREMAALVAMPGKVGELAGRQSKEFVDKRNAAILMAGEELRDRLADLQTQTYAHEQAGWDQEIDKLTAQYKKREALSADNQRLLAEIREAGHRRIEREQDEAFVREMAGLQRDLAAMVTMHFTSRERLAWAYEQDLVKWSEVEEEKSLATAKGEAERETIRAQYDLNRGAALRRYQAELKMLRNSVGWQGVFGRVFAEDLRGNEELLRDWSLSARQGLMMVQVAAESMRSVGQRAFATFAQGMGQNIAAALVYKKSIGEAMRAAAAAALESIAAESFVRAIYSTAMGFILLATHDYAGAAAAFKAAAIFGTVGVAAAVAGRAVAPRQEAAAAREAGAAGVSGGGGGSEASRASGGPSGPRVTVIVNGHIVGRAGIEELTDMINEAVSGRDVRLVASDVKRAVTVVR